MTSSGASAETKKVGGSFKFLGWIVLPLGAIMVLVVLFSHRGLYQIYRFSHERAKLEQENARLAAENARLARTIDRLQHDPVLIQDLIRQELNFVKRNEIIFQFPPEKPANTSDLLAESAAGAPAAGGVQAVSAKNGEKSKRISPPSEGVQHKRGSPRRE